MQIRMEKFTAPICEWLNRCDNSSIEVFVEKLQEITAPDERTPVAVEINRPGKFFRTKHIRNAVVKAPRGKAKRRRDVDTAYLSSGLCLG